MSKVFIAHSSENKDVAQDLFYALSKKGMEVYLDDNSLKTGEQFHSKLRELILESNYFVFLISPHSISENSYCLTALKYAEEKWAKNKKGFIPVLIEAVEDQKLPAFIRQSKFLRPRGNVTAEVTSEILSQEHGPKVGEIEILRQNRVLFANRYFEEDLNNLLVWFRKQAYYHKKKQLSFNMGLALASGGIIITASMSIVVPFFRDYGPIISSVLAIYAILYVVVIAQEPWKWRIYQIQAGKMESEYRRYVAMISPYTLGMGEARSRELFVENIEQIVNDKT